MSAATFDELSSLRRRELRDRTAVRMWLYGVLAVMFALFVVGGGTRLADAGLSITEWKPIHGVVPPLSEAQWQEEFDLYRQIPEYRQINRGMSLAAFKTIYWWEWAHRLLARGVGVLFALPFLFFWAAGRLEGFLKPRLAGLLVLGGAQGAVGWWMVASGLTERVDVSHYRLSTHLLLASVIFAATMAVARGLAPHSAPPAPIAVRRFAAAMVVLVLVQIGVGALVSGLDAGLAYNTWPLMDGAMVPGNLFGAEPAWRNLAENPKTVQFFHRLGAYLLLAAAVGHALAAARMAPGSTHARRAGVLVALVVVQAGIGIVTLVMVVPFGTALLHHAGAFVVLGFAAAHWRATRGSYPPQTALEMRR